jgi:hypothetical protein
MGCEVEEYLTFRPHRAGVSVPKSVKVKRRFRSDRSMTVGLEKLTLMNASRELGSTALFLARGVPYTVDDAIAAAIFRGTLEQTVADTIALAAAGERAEAEGVAPDSDALQAASESFRYEHNLISAGETEEWLETRGMGTADFSGWLYEKLCAEALSGVAAGATPGDALDDLSDLLRVHLWMSGEMDEISSQLSRRIAADLAMSERGEPLATAPVMQRFLQSHHLDERGLPEWLSAMRRDRAWLTEMVRMEAAFDRLSTDAITPEARARKLASMQLSLARVEIESLELDTEAAAREAFLCVHDDGSSLSDVAAETGYRSERTEVSGDALDEKIGQRLLNAREGDVVGPIASDGRFKVYQVLRKFEPTIADRAVADRIDAVILDELFDDLCARHIHAGDVARTGK